MEAGWARRACAALTAVALTLPGGVVAQETAGTVYLDDSGSPFGKAPEEAGDAAKVTMPKLDFTPSPTDPSNYDKYYYFVRADTDFETAYADIVECDGYARGLASGISYTQVPYPYAGTMAGAVGGAIGSAMAMAIFGSAEKRRLRRVNMRQCMNFKGYQRHGLSKDLWQEFHFEEGLSDMPETRRFAYLKQQALVAATAKPESKELGL
ncbi:hypothetical protein LRS12_15695 [Sphingomonas sp. J344]|nr:hypothetical protein [Sphingomonas sp. J344]MCR5872026.1 hypothetical protein [Sphingomonas sp. J344]